MDLEKICLNKSDLKGKSIKKCGSYVFINGHVFIKISSSYYNLNKLEEIDRGSGPIINRGRGAY